MKWQLNPGGRLGNWRMAFPSYHLNSFRFVYLIFSFFGCVLLVEDSPNWVCECSVTLATILWTWRLKTRKKERKRWRRDKKVRQCHTGVVRIPPPPSSISRNCCPTRTPPARVPFSYFSIPLSIFFLFHHTEGRPPAGPVRLHKVKEKKKNKSSGRDWNGEGFRPRSELNIALTEIL